MSTRADDYLQKAKEAEEARDRAVDSEVKRQFGEVAKQWRVLAQHRAGQDGRE